MVSCDGKPSARNGRGFFVPEELLWIYLVFRVKSISTFVIHRPLIVIHILYKAGVGVCRLICDDETQWATWSPPEEKHLEIFGSLI